MPAGWARFWWASVLIYNSLFRLSECFRSHIWWTKYISRSRSNIAESESTYHRGRILFSSISQHGQEILFVDTLGIVSQTALLHDKSVKSQLSVSSLHHLLLNTVLHTESKDLHLFLLASSVSSVHSLYDEAILTITSSHVFKTLERHDTAANSSWHDFRSVRMSMMDICNTCVVDAIKVSLTHSMLSRRSRSVPWLCEAFLNLGLHA